MSKRTKAIQELLKTWRSSNPPQIKEKMKSPLLALECLTTQGNDTYIGASQFMTIHASLKKVADVLDAVDQYTQLFDDLEKAEVREKSGNRFTIYSEQSIPIPFVANEKDEVLYSKETSGPGELPDQIWYQYQLKSSNHLTANDGLILLIRTGPDETAYLEYDFLDADWGMAKSFGVDRLWKDSISGIAQTDLAIKLRADNPGWAAAKVKEEAEKLRDQLPIAECVRSRKIFP